jgi:hypothetical protein
MSTVESKQSKWGFVRNIVTTENQPLLGKISEGL